MEKTSNLCTAFSAWQLKDKNFIFGSQDDIIIGRNEMVPICPFLDLVALNLSCRQTFHC